MSFFRSASSRDGAQSATTHGFSQARNRITGQRRSVQLAGGVRWQLQERETPKELQGHLLKKSPSGLSKYQRRFAILREGRLYYWDSVSHSVQHGTSGARGCIDFWVETCAVWTDLKSETKFYITPQSGAWSAGSQTNFTGASKGRYFKFDSKVEGFGFHARQIWLDAIQAHMQYGIACQSGSVAQVESSREAEMRAAASFVDDSLSFSYSSELSIDHRETADDFLKVAETAKEHRPSANADSAEKSNPAAESLTSDAPTEIAQVTTGQSTDASKDKTFTEEKPTEEDKSAVQSTATEPPVEDAKLAEPPHVDEVSVEDTPTANSGSKEQSKLDADLHAGQLPPEEAKLEDEPQAADAPNEDKTTAEAESLEASKPVAEPHASAEADEVDEADADISTASVSGFSSPVGEKSEAEPHVSHDTKDCLTDEKRGHVVDSELSEVRLDVNEMAVAADVSNEQNSPNGAHDIGENLNEERLGVCTDDTDSHETGTADVEEGTRSTIAPLFSARKHGHEVQDRHCQHFRIGTKESVSSDAADKDSVRVTGYSDHETHVAEDRECRARSPQLHTVAAAERLLQRLEQKRTSREIEALEHVPSVAKTNSAGAPDTCAHTSFASVSSGLKSVAKVEDSYGAVDGVVRSLSPVGSLDAMEPYHVDEKAKEDHPLLVMASSCGASRPSASSGGANRVSSHDVRLSSSFRQKDLGMRRSNTNSHSDIWCVSHRKHDVSRPKSTGYRRESRISCGGERLLSDVLMANERMETKGSASWFFFESYLCCYR